MCPLMARIETLVAVHLSGMGIKRKTDRNEEDLMIEVLDHFGISVNYNLIHKQNVNQYTNKP